MTELGEIVHKHVREVPLHYTYIDVKKHSIMPDHLHLLVVVKSPPPVPVQNPANAAIPAFVSTLKRYISKECGFSLWQRSYNDRIIHDRSEYEATLRYMEENPKEWLLKYGAYI